MSEPHPASHTAGARRDSLLAPYKHSSSSSSPASSHHLPTYPAPCACSLPRASTASASSSTRKHISRQSLERGSVVAHAHYIPPTYAPARNASENNPILGLETTDLEEDEKSWSRSYSHSHSHYSPTWSPYGADLEKGEYNLSSSSKRSSRSNIMASRTFGHNGEEDGEAGDPRKIQEKSGASILIFMSGPCVLLSFINALWTVCAIFIALITSPFRLGSNKPTFGQYLARLLAPALNWQLRCIHTPVPTATEPYRAFYLVVVHLFSPFLSFPVMFASWVLAVYWVSSAIVGDPAGQDKRDDGLETVLGLRNWWERYLLRSLRRE